MGVTCGEEIACPYGAPNFTPIFCEVCIAQSLISCVVFYVSLSVLLLAIVLSVLLLAYCLSFFQPLYCLSFFQRLYCLSFFDLKFLITTLVSSKLFLIQTSFSVYCQVISGSWSALSVIGPVHLESHSSRFTVYHYPILTNSLQILNVSCKITYLIVYPDIYNPDILQSIKYLKS